MIVRYLLLASIALLLVSLLSLCSSYFLRSSVSSDLTGPGIMLPCVQRVCLQDECIALCDNVQSERCIFRIYIDDVSRRRTLYIHVLRGHYGE